MPAPPSVVLFDLGGVVMDWDPAPRLDALARDASLTPSEVHRRVWEAGLARDFDAGAYTSREWYEVVRERLGLHMDFERFCDVCLGVLTLRPDVLEIAAQVRRTARTAILSDNPPLLLDALPARFPEIPAHFDPVLFSCELGALKPAPEAFRAALGRLAVGPAEVVFIDDADANVVAARGLGIDAVRYVDVDALRNALARRGLLVTG